jgi:hypothetical protein
MFTRERIVLHTLSRFVPALRPACGVAHRRHGATCTSRSERHDFRLDLRGASSRAANEINVSLVCGTAMASFAAYV